METKYINTYDYHTHTQYSRGIFGKHAIGTIEENVEAAREKGLKAIAISEHGPGHKFYGLDLKHVPEMRAEINRLKDKYHDIQIYLSLEANIIMSENGLDIRPEDMKNFDFIIAGYHFGIPRCASISNWMDNKGLRAYKKRAKLADFNTALVVNALTSNHIKILTHPGDKAPVHMDEVAKVCALTGTLMEISESHGHLTVEELKIAGREDVKFIISSDAHKPYRVGEYEQALQRALDAGIDPERIVNIERV